MDYEICTNPFEFLKEMNNGAVGYLINLYTEDVIAGDDVTVATLIHFDDPEFVFIVSRGD